MKYPLWLPRPKAWGQAIVLSLEWIPVVIVGSIFLKPLNWTDYNDPTPLFIIPVASLAMIYVLSLIHQFLWHEKRASWLPHWQSWLEGLWGFIVYIFSVCLGGLLALVIDEIYYQDGRYYLYHDRFERFFIVYVIAILAYCFHWRYLISQKFQKLTKTKIKVPDQPDSKIDPIEVELNRLKTEMGLKQMNNVKKD